MLRTVVISSLILAACDVGEIPGAGGGGDGGGGGTTDGTATGNGCVDSVTPASPAHIHTDGGTSNAGQGCMNLGCHLAGGLGPMFTFAGTVYADMAGTAPKPGATVKVEFGTTVISAVADTDGNFYSTQDITLPAKTLATACPTVAPMVGMIVTGGGNCNNCHRPGGEAVPVYVIP